MDIQKQYIEVKKTARYLSYGNLGPHTRYFWFVIHGSKMLAEQMIYKFEGFDPDKHFIIAPEALNRFYSEGFGGDVVASWMTKRDRLEEITDFSEYLSKLYDYYMAELPRSCVKTILGFSQGGTTAFRWLHARKVELNNLIAYSCWIPEDINLMDSKSDLEKINKIYTYGRQDQYLNEETIAKLREIIERNQLILSMETYEGEHKVSKKELKELFVKYIKL